KKKKFDADRIAALIDKSPDKRGAPRTSTPPTKPTDYKGPTAGVRRGTDSVLSAREQDLLKSQLSGQLKRCWHLPGGGGGIETMVVTLSWSLKQDGSLDGVPKIVRPQSGPVFQIAAEAAMRAVTRCAPFDLPREKYTVWKLVTWSFDPRDMM
ncbi:MAG: protein TolA, partial [Hyphomicrobium sp.]